MFIHLSIYAKPNSRATCSLEQHSLRTFLGARGVKGDLSKFIEDAVRWRVFHRTVQDIKAANTNTKLDEVQRIVDEAVGEVRAERRAKGRLGED